MTEFSEGIFTMLGGALIHKSAYYILFDANNSNSLEYVEKFYYELGFIKFPEVIIKVIALQVTPNPSQEMIQILNSVKEWAEDYSGIEFLQFNKND